MDVDFPRIITDQAWDAVIQHLSTNRQDLFEDHILSIIRTRIECRGANLQVLEQLIDWYPKELSFSLLLCTTRFTEHSSTLMNKIFEAIQLYSIEVMAYSIEKFQGNAEREPTSDIIVGETMTLVFSFFDDYISTPQSGNLGAIRLIRHKFPRSILYVDTQGFTPLHGVCYARNIGIFRYFIQWHLEQNPSGKGGVYAMNYSGITSLDTLIDTEHNIILELQWLVNHGLLDGKDVSKWLLIHRAAHLSSIGTIQFFLNLWPSGVLEEDEDGNLPIHLHLGLIYRPRGIFPERDFAIARLFISQGIANGGINTIGGLFHPDPENSNSCTLTMLLKEVGEDNAERIWNIIEDCMNEIDEYINVPILHAAILNKEHIPNELFQEILSRYRNRAASRNEDRELPLSYAARIGAKWNDCTSHILDANQDALNEIDDETEFPLLLLAASGNNTDLSTIYELARINVDLCIRGIE